MRTVLLALLILSITQLSFSQNFNEVKKAAEQGDAASQFNLGHMYYNGNGTLTDY